MRPEIFNGLFRPALNQRVTTSVQTTFPGLTSHILASGSEASSSCY